MKQVCIQSEFTGHETRLTAWNHGNNHQVIAVVRTLGMNQSAVISALRELADAIERSEP